MDLTRVLANVMASKKINTGLTRSYFADYKRVAELDLRKTEIEERLLEIYEELE